jgi:hypothetical protein
VIVLDSAILLYGFFLGSAQYCPMATARFEWDLRIDPASFASLAPVIGERVNESMNAKIKYTDEPLGRSKVIPDFLPAPEDLVFREEGVKVTLALSKRSVEFFKREAAKHNTQYQRMIRRLLDAYAEHHARALTSRSTGPRPASPRPGRRNR